MRFRYMMIVALVLAGSARAALVMELSTPKTHYVQHEPFWVVLTFRNTGTEDEKLVRRFETCQDHVTYYITPPGGKPYKYDSGMNCDGLDTETVCLGPGESFSADVDLSWEQRDLSERPDFYGIVGTLSRPGEHRIRAAYDMPGDRQVKLQSNECRIVVHEPKGIDRQAHDLLRNLAGLIEEMVFYDGRHATESQRDTWQQIVSRYPNSAYAPYALFSLANDYERGESIQPRSMKPDERAEHAAELFEKCAKRLAGSPLGAQAFLIAAHNRRDAGDQGRCSRMYAEMLTCPGVTDQQRLHALAPLFIEERKPPFDNYADVRVPLRLVAEAMGFKVMWNPADKTAEVSNARVSITVRPEEVSNGRMMVPLKALAPLVADRYGRCREAGQTY